MNRALTVLLMLAIVATGGPSVFAQSAPGQSGNSPDLNTIVSRMERAQAENQAHYRAYIMTRDYRLFGDDPKKPSTSVTAEVSFVPPNRKGYEILQATGSDRGEGIVRRILDKESKMAEDRSIPVSRENYDFRLLGSDTVDGRPCYVLQMVPRKKQDNLIEGRAWVDQGTFLLHRIDGVLAKNPSWWVKDVAVTLNYGAVQGMWLQTATHATADVRLFGKHTLESRATRLEAADALASNVAKKPVPRRRHTPASYAGAMIQP